MKRNHMKKGQITIFVILALIILFGFALFFYMKNSEIKIRPPPDKLEVTDDIKPIQGFVTSCLESVSKEAIIKAGNNGGYIYPNNMRVSPTYNSDALVFEPQIIPYWYYLKDDCGQYGCIYSKKPPLCRQGVECVIPSNGQNSIEEQLSRYVKENIEQCINNFTIFEEQYIITPGKLAADVIIREQSVAVRLDYPLSIEVRGENKKTNIPYFYAEQNVKLKDIYLLGEEIYQAEMEYNFLETITMNFITAYSGIDSNLLPPTSGMELFTASKKYWVRSEVKDVFEQDIMPYISMIQITNAGNARAIYSADNTDDPTYLAFADGLYSTLMIKVSNNSYFDLKANIVYPYTNTYLKVGDSEIIRPESADSGDNMILKMVGFFLNEYKFKYDITYPVVVYIEDPEAFGGEGFRFSYAMEANIRQNVPVKGNVTFINLGGFRELDLNSEIQKVNRTITIETYDKHTGKPLDGVIINYRCGLQYLIGETQNESGKAILKERFPFCQLGGEIVYEKNGYIGGAIDYSNTEGTNPKDFRIDMWPLQEKTIVVYKRTPTNIQNIRRYGAGSIALFSREVTNISDNESVMVSIQRFKQDARESDVPIVGFLMYKTPNGTIKTMTKEDQRQQILTYFAQGQIDEATKNSLLYDLDAFNYTEYTYEEEVEEYKLDFVPGTYDVNAIMMYYGSVHVPREVRRFCPLPEILGICPVARKEIVLEEQNYDSWLNGGAHINFSMTANDVYGPREKIILYVLEMPLPTTWTMLENYQAPEQYQEGRTFLLRPRLE